MLEMLFGLGLGVGGWLMMRRLFRDGPRPE